MIFANSVLPSRAPSEAGDGGKQILVFQVSTGTNARSIELVMGVFSVLLSLSLSFGDGRLAHEVAVLSRCCDTHVHIVCNFYGISK